MLFGPPPYCAVLTNGLLRNRGFYSRYQFAWIIFLVAVLVAVSSL